MNVKLKRLEARDAQRRKNAAFYDALLEKKPEYVRPVEAPGLESIYHIYAVRSRDRDAVLARLNANGVGAGIHYPFPVRRSKPTGTSTATATSFPSRMPGPRRR